MKKFNINFVGNIKKYLIISVAIMLVGFVCTAIFGVDMDINFKGGSRFTYTYEGEINTDDVKAVADKQLGKSTSVTFSQSAVSGGSSKIVITAADVVVAKESEEDSDKQGVHEQLESALQEKFKDNNIKFAESNIVESSVARGFYAKSIIAVVLAAVLVIVYIGIRFRKIGGISAALFALVALVHDVLIAFFACVFFRLEIDTNFMAVVLTIFGYSLNDTVVIYDRIRENRKKMRQLPIAEVTNLSMNQTLGRTIITSLTTFLAVIIVAIVAEFYGLTTLRSFAIPMALGLISGTYSSICLACPLWVKWQEHGIARKAKAEANYAKNSNSKKNK